MLQIRDQLPHGFLDVPSTAIHEILPAPTLIHLTGTRTEPLFVSILLHGNEDVGLKAVQQVLRSCADRPLPRSLSIFVGNVTAAALRMRRLRSQPDFNRIWPGTDQPATPEHALMTQVVEEMRRRAVFASIDLHNNTGVNPHYACICATAPQHLQLASLFSRTVVYFQRPKGVQTQAFMGLCPSITCECGKVGDESGVSHATELLEACLHAAEIPHRPPVAGDVHLFHTLATVKVPAGVSIGFGDEEADLVFPTDLDHWNFNEVGPAAEIAVRAPGTDANLIVQNEQGRNCASEYISIIGNSLRLKKRILPSMLTLDPLIIRQDCLCYFMERYGEKAESEQ